MYLSGPQVYLSGPRVYLSGPRVYLSGQALGLLEVGACFIIGFVMVLEYINDLIWLTRAY